MAQQTFTGRKRVRKFFGHIKEVAEMPNLIEVQKASYDQFLMVDEPQGGRSDEGLQAVFRSVFPISDFSGTSMLEFVRYEFEPPKYDVDECRQRGMTFAAPLKVTLRLIVFDIDEETGAKSVKDIKEQDVYMGDIPLMTMNGTFIVNGTERVIVSQMHRSPGVFFDHDKGKTHSSGKLLFAARVIPYRGSWLDIEFDAKDIVYARIDRRRKLPVTSLMFALGLDGEAILSTFYKKIQYKRIKEGWRVPFDANRFRGYSTINDLIDADTGKVVLEAGKKLTVRGARQMQEKGLKALRLSDAELVGNYIAEDLVNPKTGEIHAEAGEEITDKSMKALNEHGYKELPLLDIDHVNVGAYIRNTLSADKNMTREDALFDIYRVMRPGEPPTLDSAQAMFQSLFFDAERYDLSAVGRVKMNMRLDLDAPDTQRTLRKEDILSVIKTLVDLRDGKGEIDDIDHLGNRRVRSVGELMENQYRIGLLRMERAIKERMSSVDIDTVMPQDLINAKPAAAAVREFFGSSQLSQFMDQTNPLSEITHKRRLSALGPGGLTRERAGFEVRDVHPTHYGPHLPDRDAGRSEHRPDQLARDFRAREQVRLRRDALPQGQGRARHRRGRVPLGDGRGSLHGRAGQRAARSEGPLHRRSRGLPSRRRSLAGDPGQGRLYGRVAEAARFGRSRADPVPRERRRQPRADGLEHAAPGGAAGSRRGAVRRHRHGRRGCA
ncbi:DNA-directed RNA polymerase beta subunit [Bradyrhizobium sp. LM6.9]